LLFKKSANALPLTPGAGWRVYGSFLKESDLPGPTFYWGLLVTRSDLSFGLWRSARRFERGIRSWQHAVHSCLGLLPVFSWGKRSMEAFSWHDFHRDRNRFSGLGQFVIKNTFKYVPIGLFSWRGSVRRFLRNLKL